MKLKTIILATWLSWGVPLIAQAQSTEQSLVQVSCNDKCDRLTVSQEVFVPQIADADDQISPRRSRFSEGNQTLTKKFYAGGTLGVFFVSELDGIEIIDELEEETNIDAIDPDTGFGGSIFAGYRLSHLLGGDVEFYIFGGGAEPEDSNFSSLGVFVNPKFFLPLGSDSLKAPYLFASPGIGFVGIGFGDEIEELTEDPDTGFAFQIKAGAGLPLSEAFDVFGQIRYVNAFGIYPEDNGDEGNLSTVGLEAGFNFKL